MMTIDGFAIDGVSALIGVWCGAALTWLAIVCLNALSERSERRWRAEARARRYDGVRQGGDRSALNQR
jgi:hypothetical protein